MASKSIRKAPEHVAIIMDGNGRWAQARGKPRLFGHHAGEAKLSAAWLIEQCGWKGFREGDAGVSDMHALVLVNHGAATGNDIAGLANRVRDTVHDAFGIELEPEPVLIQF